MYYSETISCLQELPDYKNILWDYLKLTDGKAQTPHAVRAALGMHAELAKSGDMRNIDWAQYK